MLKRYNKGVFCTIFPNFFTSDLLWIIHYACCVYIEKVDVSAYCVQPYNCMVSSSMYSVSMVRITLYVSIYLGMYI